MEGRTPAVRLPSLRYDAAMRALGSAILCTVAFGCAPPFPERFLFGAATAGFQVDPGCPTLPAERCVDTRSDWYQWVTSSAQLQDLAPLISFEPLARGPGHWELYEQDFTKAKDELGLGAVRLSLEWSRIFPTSTDGLEGDALAQAASQDALATYRAMFAARRSPLRNPSHVATWAHDVAHGVGLPHQQVQVPAAHLSRHAHPAAA